MTKKLRSKRSIVDSKKRISVEILKQILFFIPVFLIFLAATPFVVNYFVGLMSATKIGEAKILNSTYAITQIYKPFVKSILLVLATIFSLVFLKLYSKKVQPSDRIYKMVFYFEILCIVLAIISVVYTNSAVFDYSQYGYSKDMLQNIESSKGMYLPLKKIPTIESIGVTTSDSNIFYLISIKSSQIFLELSKYLEYIVAQLGLFIFAYKKDFLEGHN